MRADPRDLCVVHWALAVAVDTCPQAPFPLPPRSPNNALALVDFRIGADFGRGEGNVAVAVHNL